MPVEKVLIVDDEEELLKAMSIRLDSWGYYTLTATNGKDAIDLIKKDTPDAVILDIMMPEMDGIETLRQIRKFNKEIPVFMFTAYGSDKTFEDTEELGISGFIHKGRDSSDASAAIRTVLRGIKKPEKNG